MLSSSGQRGAALGVSLVFLLVTTLGAATAVQIAATQERMAANNRFRIDSFQAAETGLRIAEAALAADFSAFASPCTGVTCNIEASILDIDATIAPTGWTRVGASSDTNGMEVWYRIINLGVTSAPAKVATAAPGILYRIVVVAHRGSARTVLEGVYVHSQA